MEISVRSEGALANALRAKGFRATYGRVALLKTLGAAGKPLAVDTIAEKVAGKLDLTNVYRALEALAGASLVRRVDLGHQHTHYELAVLVPHHHHYVCEGCGFRPAHS